jgi:hypothetical protein
MSDTKFTPAPWKIDRHRNGRTIASIGPLQADEYAGSAWIECSEEDASLAAAAPDLYWALMMVLDDPQSFDGRPRTYDVVIKALAKARGEQ